MNFRTTSEFTVLDINYSALFDREIVFADSSSGYFEESVTLKRHSKVQTNEIEDSKETM